MEQYKELYDENLELKKNAKSLNDGVQYYRSIENTMQKALVLAEKTAKEKIGASADGKTISDVVKKLLS